MEAHNITDADLVLYFSAIFERCNNNRDTPSRLTDPYYQIVVKRFEDALDPAKIKELEFVSTPEKLLTQSLLYPDSEKYRFNNPLQTLMKELDKPRSYFGKMIFFAKDFVPLFDEAKAYVAKYLKDVEGDD